MISALVLAAGGSSRTSPENKLLFSLHGRTIIEHAILAALQADIGEVIVVTGADRRRIDEVLSQYPVRLVHNMDYAAGMAGSLRTGAGAVSEDSAGIAVCLGDMPFIKPETIYDLASILTEHPDSIVVPEFDGRAGHPVLFGNRFKNELLALEGDVGARSIIQKHTGSVVEVPTDDPGILRDIDTIEEYREANA